MEDLSRNWGRACEVNSNALIKRNEDYIIYLVTFNSIFLENSLSKSGNSIPFFPPQMYEL